MRSIGLILGIALAGALVLPAVAQAAGGAAAPSPAPAAPPLTVTSPNPDMVARRMARRAARVDQDIQTLQAGLQLTRAQAALWPPVADAIHGVDTANGFRFRQAMAAAPSPVDGLKLQGDHMAAMGAAFSKLADATRPLVATLTPDQKSRLPGLLQSVRLPKVLSRALDIPQDAGGSSEGSGNPTGDAGASPATVATGSGQRRPYANGPGGPTQDENEEQ